MLAGMHERLYTVSGMTCEHCRRAVLDEVGQLLGVESVEVELATGALRVRGADVPDTAVAAAVEEAGYELAR